jgi:hypothetical protein
MSKPLRMLQRKKSRGAVERATSFLGSAKMRFAGGAGDKDKGGASGKAVMLGTGVLAVLAITALSVWLLRKRAGDETTAENTEPEEGAETAHSQEEQGQP